MNEETGLTLGASSQADKSAAELVQPMVNVVHRGRGLVVNPLDILACSCIDLDHVAFLDESRDDKFAAGFDNRGLGYVCRCIALGTRIALGDYQFNVDGRSDRDGQTIKQHHRTGHAVLEVLPRVVDLGCAQLMLLKARTVHKNVSIGLLVKILDLDFFHVRRFQFVTSLVGSIQDGVADQIAEFALVQRVALTGLTKFISIIK